MESLNWMHHNSKTKHMKPFIFFAFCLQMMQAMAADTEKTVKSKPERIIVYTQGAQVHRTAQVSLNAGPNTILFTGLENCINPSAIQVGGNGNFIVTDIQHLVHYPELDKAKQTGDLKFQKYLKNINDSIKELDYLLEDLNAKQEALQTEKNVLLNYNLYKGVSKKDSIPFLKDGLSFLREKLYNINAEQLKLKREREKLQVRKDGLTERKNTIYNELSNASNTGEAEKTDYRVAVNIIADQAGIANLNLNYYIINAGWTPSYDLRAVSNEQNIKLTYKAMIHQNSGVDWSNTKLVLSTANPNRSYVIPELNPWYLGYSNNRHKQKNYYELESKSLNYGSKDYSGSAPSSVAQPAEQVQYAYDYTSVNENFIETEYEIKLNYNIPSDGKDHYAAIMVKELKTLYRYKAIPKLNNNVYLTAILPDWEEEITMGGAAAVYYDGSFVGTTFLANAGTEDTLQLSLGIDKNIAVKKAKVKDKCYEKFLDNDKIHQYTYEFTMKNSRASKIEIDIEDQLPLSYDKTVSIEKNDLSGAGYDEITGKLKWRTTIQGKDSKKITLSYQVRSPKNSGIAFNY